MDPVIRMKAGGDMRRVIPIGALAAALAVTSIGLRGIQLELTRADIERAVKLARGKEAQRAQFHAAYQIPVADAFVERLEVITEFRRMVLITEERLAAGEWAFGMVPRPAEDALRPWKLKLSIKTRIRFHPLNAYPMTPQIDIGVGGGLDQLVPLRTHTDPQYGASDGAAGSAPLIGAVTEADFDAARAARRTLDVTVRIQGGSEVHRLVDFAALN
jgi:hypothetical protein